jgi:putative hydrolase of the HAD superfamily
VFIMLNCCMTVYLKVVESVKVNMRKPEEGIYHHTLELLNVQPHEAIFLDDLGINLKTAKDLGLKTVKVCTCYNKKVGLSDIF